MQPRPRESAIYPDCHGQHRHQGIDQLLRTKWRILRLRDSAKRRPGQLEARQCHSWSTDTCVQPVFSATAHPSYPNVSKNFAPNGLTTTPSRFATTPIQTSAVEAITRRRAAMRYRILCRTSQPKYLAFEVCLSTTSCKSASAGATSSLLKYQTNQQANTRRGNEATVFRPETHFPGT